MHCGFVDSRLRRFPAFALRAQSNGQPVENALRFHRPPTGRQLPTSSTARQPIRIKSGTVKTITQPPALAYSTPVAVQMTGTHRSGRFQAPATISHCIC